ncbi:MAG: chalcone isomerase family protein, partial [bacterium]
MLALTSTAVLAERITVDRVSLEPVAETRACYLKFIKLYDAEYLRGVDNPARCVRLSYLRGFSRAELAEATSKLFEKLQGEQIAERYREQLDSVASAYADVSPGDQYLYCLKTSSMGSLYRDNAEVLRLGNEEFADRFLQLWVAQEAEGNRPVWAFAQCIGRD